MNLSPNFTLKEMIYSQEAERVGIVNVPRTDEIGNLELLCKYVLQPLRDYIKYPISVSSGYRSRDLNNYVNGSNGSQHLEGKAADFEIFGLENYDVACWIRDNLDFDQLILEYHIPGDLNSGWIHVSYNGKYNRKECLTINKMGRIKGLVK